MVAATDFKKSFGRVFNYANNPLTIIGIGLTTLSALVIITFVVVELFGELENPYIGLFAYVAHARGLRSRSDPDPHRNVEAAASLDRRRRHRNREVHGFPGFDFNDPKIRRWRDHHHRAHRDQRGDLRLELVPRGGGDGVRRVLRRNLPHGHAARVHRLPTVAALASRLRRVSHRSRRLVVRQVQARRSQTGLAHRPQHLPPTGRNPAQGPPAGARNLRAVPLARQAPSATSCGSCVRHATDEENTPSYTAMLLKTGGGSLDIGRHGGIHWWHIESDNVIRYVPGDRAKRVGRMGRTHHRRRRGPDLHARR